MKGLIINHNTKYIGEIIKLFDGCDMINCTNFNSEVAEQYDYIVLSGGPTPDETFENIKKEKEWLKQTNKPVLGICLGLHILCHTFGGEMKKMTKNRKLNENLRFVGENYNMFYNHTYYFDRIPDGFVGEIVNGMVMWIRHKTKPILAFQGHPEVTENGNKIKNFFLENFVKK